MKINRNNGTKICARYYGDSIEDQGNGIALHNSRVYISGFTAQGDRDDEKAFISAYDLNGNLIRHQVYGNFGLRANDIAIDKAGNFLVIGGEIEGRKNKNKAGLTNLKHQKNYGGGTLDGFIIQVKISDLTVGWSSYYGGSEVDVIKSVEMDCNNIITVVGYSESRGNIAQNGYMNTPQGGGNSDGTGDAIIAKFSSKGEHYFGTYYGGKGGDKGIGLALSPNNGNIIICGKTSSGTGISFGDTYDTVSSGSPPGQSEDTVKKGAIGFIATFCDFIIDQPPQSQTAILGNDVTFSVNTLFCGYAGTVSYQWCKKDGRSCNNLSDGSDVIGSNTKTLKLIGVTNRDSGEYCVKVKTDCSEDTLCATLDIVGLTADTVCLDSGSTSNNPSASQREITLTFENLEDNTSITDAKYKWSVRPTNGANIRRIGTDLPTTFTDDLYKIKVDPDKAGTYDFKLELQYKDSRRTPTTVTDQVEIKTIVHPFPIITTIAPDPDIICEDELINITLTGTNLSRIEWKLIDDSGGNITGLKSGGFNASSSTRATFNQVFGYDLMLLMTKQERLNLCLIL